MTASTAETPDSYELFKIITRVSDTPEPTVKKAPQQPPQPVQQQQRATPNPANSEPNSINWQIADLQTQVRRHVEEMGIDISGLRTLQADIKNELISTVSSQEHIRLLDQRLERMERMLESIHQKHDSKNFGDVPKAAEFEPQFDRLQNVMRESHLGLMDTLNISLRQSPKTDFLLVLFLLTQAGVVVAYIVYKKKKRTPKKYL